MERLFFGVSWLRASLFSTEALLIPLAGFIATGRKPRLPFDDLPFFLKVRRALFALLKADAARISAGVYPASVLLSAADPVGHLKRLPKIFGEAMSASKRREEKDHRDFGTEAEKRKKNLPAYYQRNFHFQKDGYLSEDSAAIYDHQVELLFAGAGDAMRRLLLAPLKRHFGDSDGTGLRFLEIGCGTGSATRFLRAAFPRAQIVAVDLSEPYLELARARVEGVKFVQAEGEELPFKREFDAVVSVFLFHELPLAVRKQVLAESRRVLKARGIFAFVDSLQLGDNPDFDPALLRFPKEFHEPFYTSYVKNPMKKLLAEAGYKVGERELGFFSKVETAFPKR